MSSNVVVGLAAYNEEAGLPGLLDKIIELRKDMGDRLSVVVVNDGSRDGTHHIVEEFSRRHPFIRLIDHEKNRGLGEAVKTILNHVTGCFDDEDILVTLDADNTHTPGIIPDMVEKLETEKLDVVIASRFTKGGREIGLSPMRKLYSRGAVLFFKMFFPIKGVNDYSCGFRAYRVGYLKKAAQAYNGHLVTTSGFDCMAEIMARFARIGVRAGEYPLVLRYNLKQGASKMKVAKTIWGYFGLLKKVRS